MDASDATTTAAASTAVATTATSATLSEPPSASPPAMDGQCVEASAEGSAAAARSKLHRFALFFGYVGARFQGLQKNPGAITVESELERALRAASLMAPADDFAAVGWNRAARTDKGVHAAANVVSLMLHLTAGTEGAAVKALNAQLCADLRAFALERVTPSFNAKNFCSGRRYGYLLPTWVLAPAPRPRAAATLDANISPAIMPLYLACRGLGQGGCGGAQGLAGLSAEAIARDPFCSGEAATRAAAERAVALSAAAAAAVWAGVEAAAALFTHLCHLLLLPLLQQPQPPRALPLRMPTSLAPPRLSPLLPLAPPLLRTLSSSAALTTFRLPP